MFDFSNYFDVGEYLVLINNEGNIRSGISRYYYSGFGYARLYLINTLNEYEFVSGYEIHRKVCERLMNSKNPTEASIGEKLNELRIIRNDADYDWNLGIDYFNRKLASVQKKCLEIIEQIDSLKNSPPFEIN